MRTVHLPDAENGRFHYADAGASLTWCGLPVAKDAPGARTLADCTYCRDRARAGR